MAKQAKDEDRAAQEANKRYWGSDVSVNQIAETMDLSKGRLYGLLVPLPTDQPCPDCGGETEYPNRTARDRENATCPSCAGADKAPRRKTNSKTPGVSAQPASTRVSLPQRVPSRALLGAALLGVAAGIFLAVHRRR
ncbi:MAG: hypothetical protein V3T24_07605 [Longimicrobiales bacterium]